MSETFYDRNGTPIAYTTDGEHIYLFKGKPVAYISGDSIYSYSGSHLGRFKNGWVRDNDGYCVFYTQNSTGGPIKPIKKIKPVKGVKSIRPVKSVKNVRPVKSVSKSTWSKISRESFFYQ